MAQVLGSNSHRYVARTFKRLMFKLKWELISVADSCATNGSIPDHSFGMEKTFEIFKEHLLPIPNYLVPPEFPKLVRSDTIAMLVAGDYWEEFGEPKKADRLRDLVDCIEYCEDLIYDATLEWCEGHPDQPSTAELVSQILLQLESTLRILRAKHPARNGVLNWS